MVSITYHKYIADLTSLILHVFVLSADTIPVKVTPTKHYFQLIFFCWYNKLRRIKNEAAIFFYQSTQNN